MMSPDIAIAGYTIENCIHEGVNTVLYRATRLSDHRPVVLKFCKAAQPIPEQQMRLRHEYQVAAEVNLHYSVNSYKLEQTSDRVVLVLEDFGGVSLKQFKIASMVQFLSIAVQLATAIAELHDHGIIHKDIKPSNILMNPQTGEIKITDFGIASRLSQETMTLANPNLLEGTLAYLSPEQTGRMNRSVDYRTDFYSLGVTLYELITGKLPFQGQDALELVACHLSKEPTPIQQLNPDVPTAIAQIIAKLMAKNAEDRYQSAIGLQADLQQCLDEFKTTGTIQTFEIGQRDRTAQLNLPEKLYGRTHQIKILIDAFERATEGSCELVVVAGYSGIGKTTLIQELFKSMTQSKAHFVSGKFDQFKRDVPYACFVEAYGKLIRQILSDPQEQVDAWRDRFQAAVGQNGQAVIEVVPELELLIGQQPALPKVSPGEAQNRFHQTFMSFIFAATSSKCPLVEFMDDLQWADSSTIAALPTLLTSAASRHRLVILSYRDNEVDATHPLMQTLSKMRSDGLNFQQITLESLSLHDVMQFVADALSSHFSKIQPLAKLLYEKTQGNPFFLGQLLKSLHREGLLFFDFEANAWRWNIEQIRQQNITDNVVELMLAKLQELPSETQTVLQFAACIGNTFDLKTLSIVYQTSIEQTMQTLWTAVQSGFIIPLDQNYRAFLNQANHAAIQSATFKFQHDRVQQAAYELIATSQKPIMHHAIARLLLQNTSEIELEANIFEIVNHWNHAIALVSEPSERLQLVRLNQIAGHKAKSSAAYEYSFSYFNLALSCLPENDWQSNYDSTLELYLSTAQAAYLTGHFERLEELCDAILDHAQTLLDQVQAYELQIQAYVAQNRLTEAVDQALVVLQSLSIHITPELQNATTLSDSEIQDLASLPDMTQLQWLAAMRILASVEAATYYAVPAIHPQLVQTAINLSIEHGNSPESVFFYAVYGQVLCSSHTTLAKGLQFGQLASTLLSQLIDKDLKARTLVNLEGFVNHWGAAIHQSIPQLMTTYHLGVESGDLEFAALALHCHCLHAYFAGEALEKLQSDMRLYETAIHNLHQEAALSFHDVWKTGVIALVSQPDKVYPLIKAEVNSVERNSSELAHQLLNQLMLAYLFGDYTSAIAASTQLDQYIDSLAGMYCVAIHNVYTSLTYLVLRRENELEKVASNQDMMKVWAQYAPMNFQHKYDLVEAERARLLGQNYDAMESYDRAIAGALNNNFIQEAAIANERAAEFYFSLSKPKIAQAYLVDAYQQYQQWGATAKVKHLEEIYSDWLTTTSHRYNATTTITATRGSTSTSTEFLDFATALKATEAIAGELILEKLLDRLLHIVLENAGAQKGCVILEREGELFIEVSDTNQDNSEVVVESVPLTSSDSVPLSVIQYVARTKQPIVLANAIADELCATDPYVLQHLPKSLLCAPVVYQGKFIGLIYLENNLIKGAFTDDRLEVVKLLVGQAAIAIENAKLYKLEQEKTHQLQAFLSALKQSEEKFKRLFDDSTDALLLLGDQGFIDCNQAAVDLFQKASKSQLCSAHPSRISPEFQPDGQRSQDKANAMIQKAIQFGHHRFEWVHQKSTGEDFWTEVILTALPHQEEIILHSVVRDISDRKAAEAQIQQKNQALEQALTQLQQSQAQVVQAEKMSALGNLVAGVAHEINNPIGFLNGSINNAKDYVKDILEHLALYQQHYSDAAQPIQDHADEIDLEFVSEDLLKLLTSMKGATDRIKAISTSLRTFSRADTEHTVPADIHEGIDSTILILKYRLKADQRRPAIQVITNYGSLPDLDCFPGQLNQVFMNILANAIDMFDEIAEQSSFTELEANPQKITIQTLLKDQNTVEIQISDNGKGMPEEVQAKIFDHLFTTKGVGKGTGLGLAIARQIIEEKHGGTLTVDSKVGQGTTFIIQLPNRSKKVF